SEAAPKTFWNDVPVRSVAFSPDGKMLAAGDMGGKGVRLRDLVDGREWQLALGFGGHVRAVAFAGNRTLVAGLSPWKAGAPTVVLFDVAAPNEGPKVPTPSGHTKEVWTVAAAPDGATFASSAADGTVRVWSADTGKLLHTIDVGRVTDVSPSVAIAPDG